MIVTETDYKPQNTADISNATSGFPQNDVWGNSAEIP